MLAYLEELCSALLAHDTTAVYRLLANPLARLLPRQVREEALAISRANPSSLRAPIQVLRFFHQTLQLGDEPISGGGDWGEGVDESATDGSGDSDGDRDFSRAIGDRETAGAVPSAPGAREMAADRRDQIELPLELASDRRAAAA